jgi:hypothetical protein
MEKSSSSRSARPWMSPTTYNLSPAGRRDLLPRPEDSSKPEDEFCTFSSCKCRGEPDPKVKIPEPSTKAAEHFVLNASQDVESATRQSGLQITRNSLDPFGFVPQHPDGGIVWENATRSSFVGFTSCGYFAIREIVKIVQGVRRRSCATASCGSTRIPLGWVRLTRAWRGYHLSLKPLAAQGKAL